MTRLSLLELYITEYTNTLDNTLLTTDYTDTDNENERWKGLK